jgi:hypothetical protein
MKTFVQTGTSILILAVVASGCLPGMRGDRLSAGEERALAQEILHDLRLTEGAFTTIKASAEMKIMTPTMSRPARGPFEYTKPDYLYLKGVHHRFGTVMFEMESAGDDWRLVLPQEGEYFSSDADLAAQGLPTGFTPAEMAGELLGVEGLEGLQPDDLAIRHLKERNGVGEAVVCIERGDAFQRELELVRVPEGRWRVVESSLRDPQGQLTAQVLRSEFAAFGSAEAPTHFVARFPQKNARITLKLKRIEVDGMHLPQGGATARNPQ